MILLSLIKGTYMKFFSRLIKFFVVFSVVMTFSVADDMMTLSGVIDKSREQEILVQKILKNYIMVGTNNRYNNPEERLKNNILEFEKNINALDEFATNKAAFNNIENIIINWDKIKVILAKPKSIKIAKKLRINIDEMSVLTKETTKLYTIQTGVVLGVFIDAAASLGVNSQKMAMLYLLKAWNTYDVEAEKQMKIAIKSFEESMKILIVSKLNTPEMTKSLDVVQKNFLYFKIMDELDSSSIPTLIYKKSDIILKDTKSLAALYSKSVIVN